MIRKTKVKVCGMRDAENIRQIVELKPDFIGFIFYPESKRYVGEDFPVSIIENIPSSVKKVGVFVDELLEHVVRNYNIYGLDYVQLHGKEQAAYCQELMTVKIKVIKAFSIDEYFDPSIPDVYADACNYFLFDTKSPIHGGTGKKFDWNFLHRFSAEKPFFLSGGIGPDDVHLINEMNIPGLEAVDINSRFEQEPGLKNVIDIKSFMNQLK